MKFHAFLICTAITFTLLNTACEEGKTDDTGYSLRTYIKDNGDPVIQLDSLLAFATEVNPSFMKNTGDTISIFFLPPDNSTEYKFFESDQYKINVYDLTTFHEMTLETRTEYNGRFIRFLHPGLDFPRWARISCKKDEQIFISTAVMINTMSDSTINGWGLVTIDFEEPAEPLFSWENDATPGTSMYLQLLSDQTQDLISGTMTTDKYFQFYDLSNVVKNIYPVTPSPVLLTGQIYTFILMGLDSDQWVKVVSETTFQIP